MADENAEQTRAEDEQSNGHHFGRVAAIAAASGATAYAARKALGAKSSGDDDNGSRRKKDRSDSGKELISSAVASGWNVAKDSLTPLVEDAAAKAGAFVAERSPELVRDVVMPRFISGFERARRKSSSDEDRD